MNMESEATYKSGFVAIVGRPSAGKSTLINTICRHPVSIVASVPQTTRNIVRGIYTTDKVQLVFLDTPGFHLSEKKMNQQLKRLVLRSFHEVDAIAYVLDTTRSVGEEENAIFDLLKEQSAPIAVALNKSDHTNSDILLSRESLDTFLPKASRYVLSAKSGQGVPDLMKFLGSLMPSGPALYPSDVYTDQDPQFRITEIVRQSAFHYLKQELPHSLFTEIAHYQIIPQKKSKEIAELQVEVTIFVEKESQKGMVVGKGGTMIARIRTESQSLLEKIFPYPLHLSLRVQRMPKWRRKSEVLKKIVF